MMLEPRLEHMEWYGRGPHENYVDRCSGAFLGRWRSTVTERYVAYCRPQDNGYACDVHWAAFTDGAGCGVRMKGSEPLFVQALHQSCEDLEFARHRSRQERIWNEKPPRAEVCLSNGIYGDRPRLGYFREKLRAVGSRVTRGRVTRPA